MAVSNGRVKWEAGFKKKKRNFPDGPVAKTPNAGGSGSIPAWGTGNHMLQLRVCMPQ